MAKELLDRSPPRDKDAELRLLGCCILDAKCLEGVTSEDFYSEMAVALFREVEDAANDADGSDHASLFLARVVKQRDKWYDRFRYPVGAVVYKALTAGANVHEAAMFLDRVKTARKYRKILDLALTDIQDMYDAWDQQAMVLGIEE